MSGWGSKNPIPDAETGQALLDTVYSSSKNKQLYNIYNGELIKFQPDTVEESNMKCFGNKQKLAIEYEIMNKVACFEFWVDNKPLCCFFKNGKRQQYKLTKWELSQIVEWLIKNERYILNEIEFPLQVNAKTSMEFLDKSGTFDSDDIEEFHNWYTKRQDWYFRHSWYFNRGGSCMADIMFRRDGKKIEIEWNNTYLYEEIKFVNPKGIYYVDITIFQQVINEFIEDYKFNYAFTEDIQSKT